MNEDQEREQRYEHHEALTLSITYATDGIRLRCPFFLWKAVFDHIRLSYRTIYLDKRLLTSWDAFAIRELSLPVFNMGTTTSGDAR